MEVMGYIISGSTIFIGVIFGIFRKTSKLLIEAKVKIQDEFSHAYKEYGFSVSGAFIQEELNRSSDRLKKLHYASTVDINYLNFIDKYSSHLKTITILIFLFCVLSLIIGKCIINADNNSLRILFFIIIPLFFLCLVLLILNWFLKIEDKLNKISNKYEKIEY